MAKIKKYKDYLKTPFDTGIRNFTSIAKFFIYYVPYVDTPQSFGKIDSSIAESLFNKIITESKMQNTYKILKRIQPNSWKKFNLDNEYLDFENSRMIFNKFSNETNLNALIRHLRNALAHGYIYVLKNKKGNFIFLVDCDPKKEYKPTAKIVISMGVLEQWAQTIKNQLFN